METKKLNEKMPSRLKSLKRKNHDERSLSFRRDWFELVSEDANLTDKGQRKTVVQVVLRPGLLPLCEVGSYRTLTGIQSESGKEKDEILHDAYGLIMGSKGNLVG